MILAEIRRLCVDCAARFPNPEHAADLLLGTAAQESGFIHRRQIGFGDELRGGFGLWQVEPGSIKSSLSYINRRLEFTVAGLAFLASYQFGLCDLLRSQNVADIANIMRDPAGDPMACLFARYHFLRISAPIPEDLHAQAAYWKQYYNTKRGKGIAQQYIDNWQRLCQQEEDRAGDHNEP